MEERRWAWRCYQQAASVSDLASLQQLIGEIEQIQAEPDLRAEPLTALWEQSRSIGLSTAYEIEAFKSLFAATDRLPEQGLPLQKTMLASMDKFPRSMRLLMFDFAYTMAEQHRLDQANFWYELAQALPQVTPASEYLKRYQALLNRLARLNTPQKAELIPLLAKQLQFNRRIDPTGSEALSAHIFLQQQTLLLPPSLQGASVGMLAAATEELPAIMRVARYAEMRQLALSLPDEQLGVALRKFPFGLVHLPSEHHAHEFQLLEPALLRVLLEQRVQVARSLLEWALLLGDKFSKQVWQHALQLLDGRDATELLEALSKVRVSLRTPEWQDAVKEVTAFMDRNRFTEQTRTTIDTRMLQLLHPEDRMTL
ncbi:hypothetical protein KQH49_12150 [Mycetohabitans sp. B5]|uniref:Uncharacterized protein n=1 Tax=Mycetohabitans endofungorum TaxID=417203 RepID=A0A2P5KCR8_9BURK|nr:MULTISPECIES: hypothetical protein [Mycetohabitans]MCG1055636.1 hypothetical protein [Mycetohabitans sp. B5]PPB84498.1 hypothetical protein B0O95_103189 [Mycetohabitans endofungorum]